MAQNSNTVEEQGWHRGTEYRDGSKNHDLAVADQKRDAIGNCGGWEVTTVTKLHRGAN